MKGERAKMRWTNRRIVEEFGEERNGEIRMVCPTCENSPEFETIEQWKDHMQKHHGGFTSSEMQDGQVTPEGTERQTVQEQTPRPKPKRMSQRARELNDKVNRCVSIIVKHIVSGINDAEREELETNRSAITEAFVGIEFDFEERLFSITGKWAVLAVLVMLYILPQIPSMKESIAKAKQNAAEKKLNVN